MVSRLGKGVTLGTTHGSTEGGLGAAGFSSGLTLLLELAVSTNQKGQIIAAEIGTRTVGFIQQYPHTITRSITPYRGIILGQEKSRLLGRIFILQVLNLRLCLSVDSYTAHHS
jgi:hypothetical protein